jgi:hypothetical protein
MAGRALAVGWPARGTRSAALALPPLLLPHSAAGRGAGAGRTLPRVVVGAWLRRSRGTCRMVAHPAGRGGYCLRRAVHSSSGGAGSAAKAASKPGGGGSSAEAGRSPSPSSILGLLRARLLAALQKDGSTPVNSELSLLQTLRIIFQTARPELPLLCGAAVGLVVSSATSLIFPKAVGSIVDTIAPAADPVLSQPSVLLDCAAAATRRAASACVAQSLSHCVLCAPCLCARARPAQSGQAHTVGCNNSAWDWGQSL